jgi:hypothetical protein
MVCRVDKDALLKICQDFIKNNKISCAETVYQTDRVIENVYEFIESVCNIVGYAQMNDDNWTSKGSIRYTWNDQPFYYDSVRHDPVLIEMQRLDQLETIVQMRDTTWVKEYCTELMRRK